MSTGPGASAVPGDRIELRGLRVVGRCGVLPEEVERGQPLEVDLDVVTDMAAARASDDLADTVDYGAICTAVEQAIVDDHVRLLEFLAGKLADAVLAVDGRIVAVEVAVRKLRPPVPQHLATSGVRITRLRS